MSSDRLEAKHTSISYICGPCCRSWRITLRARSLGRDGNREIGKSRRRDTTRQTNTHTHTGTNHLSSSCVCGVSIRFTERRGKKTVRFDGGTNVGGPQEEEWSWEADRQGSQDSATKDSGIDTSSTFTSSEDSNRGDLPKVRGQVTGV